MNDQYWEIIHAIGSQVLHYVLPDRKWNLFAALTFVAAISEIQPFNSVTCREQIDGILNMDSL